MAEKANDSQGIGSWPKWKQIALFSVLFVTVFGAFQYYKSTQRVSPQAQSIKTYLKPIAVQLERAHELGDREVGVALLEPAGKVIRDFDELDEAKKATINSTSLRYCMLASTHLLSGAIQVSKHGRWADKTVYEAALKACK